MIYMVVNYNMVYRALATMRIYNYDLNFLNIIKQLKVGARNLLILMTMRETGYKRKTIRTI